MSAVQAGVGGGSYTIPFLFDSMKAPKPRGILQPARMLKQQVSIQEFSLYRESSPPPLFGLLLQVFA